MRGDIVSCFCDLDILAKVVISIRKCKDEL